MGRKKTPPEIEEHVLMASARRCALCFGLDGDLRRKKGQIAHIDRDASNADEANLVFLCLEHHDEYDSSTSQAKGITHREVRAYKATVIEAIAAGAHIVAAASRSPADDRDERIRERDSDVFRQADELMSERDLRRLLTELETDDAHSSDELQPLERFLEFFSEVGNQYISDTLCAALEPVLDQMDQLMGFLARNFFYYPEEQTGGSRRYALYPALNMDRDGPGTPETLQRYLGLDPF